MLQKLQLLMFHKMVSYVLCICVNLCIKSSLQRINIQLHVCIYTYIGRLIVSYGIYKYVIRSGRYYKFTYSVWYKLNH